MHLEEIWCRTEASNRCAKKIKYPLSNSNMLIAAMKLKTSSPTLSDRE